MRSNIIGFLGVFAVICNFTSYSRADETMVPAVVAPAPAVVAPALVAAPRLDLDLPPPLIAPLPSPALMLAVSDEGARIARARATRIAGIVIAGLGGLCLVSSLILEINAFFSGFYIDDPDGGGSSQAQAQAAAAAARPYQQAALATAAVGGGLIVSGVTILLVGNTLAHQHKLGALSVAPSSDGIVVHF